MSVGRKSIRLCQSCRSDLFTLFEFGFSAPKALSRTRPIVRPRPRNRFHDTLQNRSFSSTVRRQEHEISHGDSTPQEAPQGSRARVASEHGHTELQALEQIEKELGIPLDEAIQEDELAARDTQSTNEPAADDDSAEITINHSNDQVRAVRDGGGSGEDVVREARSVFGEYLPEGTLNEEETKVYVRLYGAPVEQDLVERGLQDANAGAGEDEHSSVLINEDGDELEILEDADHAEKTAAEPSSGVGHPQGTVAYIPFSAEANARAREIAEQLGGELYQPEHDIEEDEDVNDDDSPDARAHPLTTLGRFSTSPRTIFLNHESYVQPLTEMLGKFSNKQLKEMCEKTFGGPGLPDSALTPRSGNGRKQLAIPLDPSQHVMGEMEANAYFASVIPPTYAAITSVLSETRKRLGSSWLRELLAKPDGPRVLDAGAGGAGILAWRDIVSAEWQSLHYGDDDIPEPPQSKGVVLAGSDTIRHRSAALLENTTFIPRLPDYVHSRDGPTIDDDRPLQARKQFDVIIAPHTLFPLNEEWRRKQHVQNLWSLLSSNGGVLILLEKGIHRGFEAIAAARDLLLTRYVSSPGAETYEAELQHALSQEQQIIKKDPGMIVAPCTNHSKCPMYTVQGVARGRKDMCSFQQRYIRPGFLQRILGASDRNHDEVDFSYISVMKGKDIRGAQPQSYDDIGDPYKLETASSPSQSKDFPLTTQLPRIVFQPLKRRGHVTIDLCTPAGKIERWTIPKSYGKQAYRDARKSKWGDLWALGAKTQIQRNLRLGTKTDKEQIIKDKITDDAAERKELLLEEALNEIAYSEIESEDVFERAPRTQKAKSPQKVGKDIGSLGRTSSKVIKRNDEDPEAVNAFMEEWEKDYEAALQKFPGRKGVKGSDSSRAAKKMARMERAGVEPNLTLPWMQSNEAAGRRTSRRHSERSQ